jgi:hypothetical protein
MVPEPQTGGQTGTGGTALPVVRAKVAEARRRSSVFLSILSFPFTISELVDGAGATDGRADRHGWDGIAGGQSQSGGSDEEKKRFLEHFEFFLVESRSCFEFRCSGVGHAERSRHANTNWRQHQSCRSWWRNPFAEHLISYHVSYMFNGLL